MKIAIVGAGVAGLTTGIRLRETGHDAVIYAEQRAPHVTSNRAGAVFSPFRARGDERRRRWTATAYEALCRLAAERGPECGVSMTTLREYSFSASGARPWWADCVQGFREFAPPAGFAAADEARVPRMAMGRYMPWLEQRFIKELGGAIIERRIGDLRDALNDGVQVVVNCSGLGARMLAADENVRPMRGQILHVPNTLGLTDSVVEEARDEITTYVFPFDDYVVLGGTYERDQWSAQTDPAALEAIVQRCRNLLRIDGFARWAEVGSERIRELAGLRPARVIDGVDESVRLEVEDAGDGRWIVHNYGHGRVGVTLSWGCAAEVAELVARM